MMKFYDLVLKLAIVMVLVLLVLKLLALVQITWGQAFIPWVVASTIVISISFLDGFLTVMFKHDDNK